MYSLAALTTQVQILAGGALMRSENGTCTFQKQGRGYGQLITISFFSKIFPLAWIWVSPLACFFFVQGARKEEPFKKATSGKKKLLI